MPDSHHKLPLLVRWYTAIVGHKLVPHTRLFIPLKMEVNPSYILELTDLVDTGCETNLVRTGLIPDSYFHSANNPVNFVAANQTNVKGGHREICFTLHFDSVDPDTGFHSNF